MSYCRFSSDNFRSDVYVYFSVGDMFVCHVANRKISNIEECPQIESPAEDPTLFYNQYKSRSNWMDNYAVREDINHELAGTTFSTERPDDMAQSLLDLREEGFHVPQYVIDNLLEEAKEWESK